MDIKLIQLDFSSYNEKNQKKVREMIKLVRDLNVDVDLSGYQDLFYFRYCDDWGCFRFFEDIDENLTTLDYESFMKEFKNKVEKKVYISQKEYDILKKNYNQIGEILNNFKKHRE